MSWIKVISYNEAGGKLKQVYDRIKGPGNAIDNILLSHSLRPHTLEGHMSLYKNVLHHSSNTLREWFLEAIGVYVSLLNKCSYCVDHHFEGMKRILLDNQRSDAIKKSLDNDNPAASFSGKELLLMQYARKLTLTPAAIAENDIRQMQENGIDDGEILEVNQVVSYFAYANRLTLGLGTEMDGETLGLSPSNSENEDDWHHQ